MLLHDDVLECLSKTQQPWKNEHISLLSNSRASTEEAALESIVPWARSYGVSRVAEITRLDRLGIPNYHALRPRARHPSAIVSAGKGISSISAIAGALFECFERWAAEEISGPTLRASPQAIRDGIDPKWVTNALQSSWDGPEIEWTAGFDLAGNSTKLVPVCFVEFPTQHRGPLQSQFKNHTDGIAAGTSPTEAICHAILEVFERHAIRQISPPAIHKIHLDSLPDTVREVCDRFRSNHIDVAMFHCPSPTGIPVVYALSRDNELPLAQLCCSASGSHPDSAVAALRAILELTQSRASFISGSREDVSFRIAGFENADYFSHRERIAHWFDRRCEVDFSAIPSRKVSSFADMLRHLNESARFWRADCELICVPLREFHGLYGYRVFSGDFRNLS